MYIFIILEAYMLFLLICILAKPSPKDWDHRSPWMFALLGVIWISPGAYFYHINNLNIAPLAYIVAPVMLLLAIVSWRMCCTEKRERKYFQYRLQVKHYFLYVTGKFFEFACTIVFYLLFAFSAIVVLFCVALIHISIFLFSKGAFINSEEQKYKSLNTFKRGYEIGMFFRKHLGSIIDFLTYSDNEGIFSILAPCEQMAWAFETHSYDEYASFRLALAEAKTQWRCVRRDKNAEANRKSSDKKWLEEMTEKLERKPTRDVLLRRVPLNDAVLESLDPLLFCCVIAKLETYLVTWPVNVAFIFSISGNEGTEGFVVYDSMRLSKEDILKEISTLVFENVPPEQLYNLDISMDELCNRIYRWLVEAIRRMPHLFKNHPKVFVSKHGVCLDYIAGSYDKTLAEMWNE